MTPNIKQLLDELNKISKKTMSKIFYSLFLMIVLQTLLCSLIMFPVIKGEANQVATIILGSLSSIVVLLFQFGFASLLLRMVKNEFVTLGFIFYGFKKPKLSFPAIFAFLGMFAIIAILSNYLLNFVPLDSPFDKEFATQLNMELETFLLIKAIMTQASIFTLISFFFVIIPFAFTFYFRLENPSKNIFWSMKKSLCLIFSNGNYFRLIIFALRAAGKRLVIAIILMILISYLNSSNSLGIITMILDFIYFLNIYSAIIRIYLSVPIMFTELTKKIEVGKVLNIEVSE